LNEIVKVLQKLKKCQPYFENQNDKDAEAYCENHSFPTKIYAVNGKIAYKEEKNDAEKDLTP
jgi:hypothetical protein